MITEFDTKGFAAQYKREFGDCLDRCDYEKAIDAALKFAKATEFPELHLALGMLYLRMTDDSDDIELCCLAYREFMMHIRRDPQCERAYRGLLIAVHLRCELRQEYECCKWIEERGIDLGNIISALEDGGIILGAPKDDPIDFDAIFTDGEYGRIDPHYDAAAECASSVCYSRKAEAETEPPARAQKRSNIISFRGGASNAHELDTTDGNACDANGRNGATAPHPIEFTGRDETDEIGESELRRLLQSVFDNLSNELQKEVDRTDTDRMSLLDEINIFEDMLDDDDDPETVMRLSELYYERGDNKKALKELDKIEKNDELYYYALSMRALIYFDDGDDGKAEDTLNKAIALRPGGALAVTLICKLYEKQKRFYKIPSMIKQIDIKDFMDGDHVYEAFKLVLKYSEASDALRLIKAYIDEYNILDIRLVYAQLMYNLGEKSYAVNELYRLSRVFYDEMNVGYFYTAAKRGDSLLPVDLEAPPQFLTEKVEGLMRRAANGGLTDDVIKGDDFTFEFEFFISLEFKNDAKLLKRMLNTVRILAADGRLESKVRDSLVSPYVEPIVKAVILSQIFAEDSGSAFIAEMLYSPISDDSVPRLKGGYRAGVYTAYAYALAFGRYAIKKFCDHVERCAALYDGIAIDDRAVAYTLIKKCWNKINDGAFDGRIAYALGYDSKAAAERDYKTVSQIIDKRP